MVEVLVFAERLYCQGKDARRRFAVWRSGSRDRYAGDDRRKGAGQETRRYLVAFGIGVLALAGVPAAGFGQAGDYQNLEPGQRADLDEKAPVNFVFVGYDQDDVSAGRSAPRFQTSTSRSSAPGTSTRASRSRCSA